MTDNIEIQRAVTDATEDISACSVVAVAACFVYLLLLLILFS